MRMVRPTIPFLVILLLVLLPVPAMASIQYPTEDPGTGCGEIDPDTPCYASGGGTLLCTDSYGCPACGMDMSLKKAVCYRLLGAYGFCSCKPRGTTTYKGELFPVCETNGSCAVRRR